MNPTRIITGMAIATSVAIGLIVATAQSPEAVIAAPTPELIEVPVIVFEEVEIEVPILYDDDLLNMMNPDAASCWRLVNGLTPAIQEILAIPISCQPMWEDGPAGTYDGSITIFYHGANVAYYNDLAWHELGHAWDQHMLTWDDRADIMNRLGWDTWNVEAFADVFALASGNYRQYVEGVFWRASETAPTEFQLGQLTQAGYLPEF